MPVPGDTLENPKLRTRLVWRETASSTGGSRVAAELWMNSDAAERPEHLHPQMNEKLSVIAGRARVRLLDNDYELGPGESLDFPAGTPHGFGRANQDELHVLLEGWPALHWDAFTTKMWNVDMNSRGRPDMLRIALVMQQYPEHMYMAAAPIPVQKVLFTILAGTSRLMRKGVP